MIASAVPHGRARARVLSAGRRSALARESLPVLVVCLLAGLVLALAGRVFATDAWLALVVGRLIAQHGLQHHDTLTVIGHGREWVDQQWLGQLLLYGLQRLGGVRLLVGVNIALVVGAFAGAVAVGRRRGAAPTTVAVVAFVAILPYVVTASAVRTQSLAYLPFVALAGLMMRRSPVTPARAGLALLVLAIWANVHGSVLLGALVVSARGAVALLQARRGAPRERLAPLLLLAPWLCVFASPYNLHLASYYAATAFNSSFSTYLDYWAPSTLSPVSAPLYLLLLSVVYLLGRARATYTAYESVLLGGAVLIGLLAIRNWTFASLLAIMLVPAGLDAVRTRRPRTMTSPFGAAVALISVVGVVGGSLLSLTHPPSAYTAGFPAGAAEAVQAQVAADPRATVYASIRFGDWLLWQQPRLAGRLRFDARYELLRGNELERLTLFRFGAGVGSQLGRHQVFVLDPESDARAIAALRGRLRVVYDTKRVFVADGRRAT